MSEMLTFVGVRAGAFPGGVVALPAVVRVLLHHHQASGDGHLPLGHAVQHVAAAAPPQHGEGGVALEHAERLRGVGRVEAQARAGAQVEEAMLGDPLPQHAARGPLTVVQNRAGPIHGDAALQRLALQDEHTLL